MTTPSREPITIRPATHADFPLAYELIYLSMGSELDWLFGREPGHPALAVTQYLFNRRNNRASCQFAYLASTAGRDVGLLLAYPGWIIRRLDGMTALQLAPLLGLPAVIRLARSQTVYGELIETLPDEFYISNLATLPQYQGLGVGRALMAYAETLARRAGLGKCSLIVTYHHEPARRLYEKLGYTHLADYPIDHPQVAEGSGGYRRMVKTLPPVGP